MLTLIQSIHAELKGYAGERHSCKAQAVLQANDGLQAQSADCTESVGSEFQPGRAYNQGGTSDITYLRTDEGWLYLAIVLDLFNREVVVGGR